LHTELNATDRKVEDGHDQFYMPQLYSWQGIKMMHVFVNSDVRYILLIQYPYCQRNNIGLTEYSIKREPIFQLFRPKK
jgi:hypothetical protein